MTTQANEATTVQTNNATEDKTMTESNAALEEQVTTEASASDNTTPNPIGALVVRIQESTVTRQTKTGFSIVRPKMSDCNKEAKLVYPDAVSSLVHSYAQKLYKAAMKEYKTNIRQAVMIAKESGFVENGLSFSETKTGYNMRPSYKLEKPKADKVHTLRKTDKGILDSMLSVGTIEDVEVYVQTIANNRAISADSIRDAVIAYVEA